MFAYKTAVAIKKLGYKNIKIYNGGLKDWKKSGYKIESIDPLPQYDGKFLTAEEVLELISDVESKGCIDDADHPLLTIVDYRVEGIIKKKEKFPSIKTGCKTVRCLLDDMTDPQILRQIPKTGTVLLVCETGNRDKVAMRLLYGHGYTNTVGLQFGMRGWIKLGYPVDEGY